MATLFIDVTGDETIKVKNTNKTGTLEPDQKD